MVLHVVLVLVAVAGGVFAGRRRIPAGNTSLTELAAIRRRLEDLHRVQKHHQVELDRRLQSVEKAMARTENETRMLAASANTGWTAARPEEDSCRQPARQRHAS